MSASPEVTYLYQLQKATYASLAATPFKIAVVDCDDAQLTSAQVANLENSGKTVFSYLSVGEAEDYRDYWIKGNWDAHKPSFLLNENKDWEGNYRVKFWDPNWQKLMIDKAVTIAKTGYDGMYLDIIDAYQVPEVIKAYGGNEAALRQEMINFVIRLSSAVKAVDPNFKVIPQNAVGLLALHEDTPTLVNAAYLKAIDGVGKEDTWTNGNAKVSWTKWDLEYLKLATDNGKFVLAIDYPTKDAAQMAFIENAIGKGFIPFIGNRALDGTIDSTNYLIPSKIPAGLLNNVKGEAPITALSEAVIMLSGTEKADTLYGTASKEQMNGGLGKDKLYGGGNHDTINGGGGDDHINGQSGDDSLLGGDGKDKIYGEEGNDILYGNAKNDVLDGGAGNDSLYGGIDNDSLYGGSGNDLMDGGTGKDAFYFGANSGNDTVAHFDNPGKTTGDLIYISKAIYGTKAAAILSHISYANGDAVVDLGVHGFIHIEDVAAGSLTVNDFMTY